MRNISVEKNDILKIGNTIFEENGNVNILCSIQTAKIEEILLRNILLTFNEEYKIISEEDFEWDNGDKEIKFITNMPWNEYVNVGK